MPITTSKTSNRIDYFSVAYLALFVIFLGSCPVLLTPVFVAKLKLDVLPWQIAAPASILWLGLLWVVKERCTSPDFSFWKGLYIITACMRIGWQHLSFLTVFPALLVATAASIFFTLTRKRGNTALSFQHLVRKFYEHCMWQ